MRVGGSYSNFENVVSGIAQGTILGPLLFILYIDKLSELLDTSSNWIKLYADDSKLYGDCTSVDDCLTLFDNLLDIEDWCSDWQLSINSEKCEVLHMGRNNNKFPYRINVKKFRVTQIVVTWE